MSDQHHVHYKLKKKKPNPKQTKKPKQTQQTPKQVDTVFGYSAAAVLHFFFLFFLCLESQPEGDPGLIKLTTTVSGTNKNTPMDSERRQ